MEVSAHGGCAAAVVGGLSRACGLELAAAGLAAREWTRLGEAIWPTALPARSIGEARLERKASAHGSGRGGQCAGQVEVRGGGGPSALAALLWCR